VRGAAGLILIVVGGLMSGAWWALSVVGLVPLAAGVFDFCVLGPLRRLPFAGRGLRNSLQHR
jgi:hypothetical protein